MMGKNHVLTNISAGLLALDAGIGVYRSSSSLLAPCRERLHVWVDSMIAPHPTFGWLMLAGYAGFSFLILMFAALLPDIDTPDSTLGRFVPIHGKHRTWSHTIWIPLLICALGYEVTPWFYVLAFGYTWHLVMDSFSACGVCWFWPFQKYREYGGGARVASGHTLKLYHAGDAAETCLAYFLFIIAVLVTVVTIWQICRL